MVKIILKIISINKITALFAVLSDDLLKRYFVNTSLKEAL